MGSSLFMPSLNLCVYEEFSNRMFFGNTFGKAWIEMNIGACVREQALKGT